MKLIEALSLIQKAAASGAAPLSAFLACGFTPLHLQTFLGAHLSLRFPDRRPEIQVGLFGDLHGNVQRIAEVKPEGAAIVIEWADLDPRLSRRQLGGWRPADLADIARTARAQLDRLADAVERVSGRCSIAVSLPSLPLPPAAHTARWQLSPFELSLREAVLRFAQRAAALPLVRLMSEDALDQRSTPANRLDVRMEIEAGHPYTMVHADAMADLLSWLIRAPLPKKGLITDLDGTLWRGLVGEDGAANVAWSLDGHAQIHGLYQQVLRALADQGVLLGAASKNDRAVVDEAFARTDLVLDSAVIFPIEAHWQAKSESVSRILKAWNIGAESVVFVDDSPMELAEVKRAHPAMECLLFRGDDAKEAYALLGELRDLFAKEVISAEDALRMASLRRAGSPAEDAPSGASQDAFLEQIAAVIELDFRKDPRDLRPLELVNKTNQWNLNGRRETEAAWLAGLSDPEVIVMVASYRDRFGPLGKIAVLRGRRAGARALAVDTWVMSCRAFARRIEHRCLVELFERLDVDEITFDHAPTARNGPLREFFEAMVGHAPEPGQRLSRRALLSRCPPLYHEVSESP